MNQKKELSIDDLTIIGKNLRGKLRFNVKLSKSCWFATGGPAKAVFIPDDIQDLQLFLRQLDGGMQIEIFGVGSNLLIRDGGFSGVIIRLGRNFNWVNEVNQLYKIDNDGNLICTDQNRGDNFCLGKLSTLARKISNLGKAVDISSVEKMSHVNKNFPHIPKSLANSNPEIGQDNDIISSTIPKSSLKNAVFLRSGANTLDLNLSHFAAEKSAAGLEFYSGIPGTIGGALAMNAGAYGGDTSNSILSCLAINKNNGNLHRFTNEEMGFIYRGNSLSNQWIFLEADFIAFKSDISRIGTKMEEIQTSRRESQPIKSKTGGSTYRNLQNYSAWQLIAAAGCCGLKIGGAQMSEMHCNFLVNNGDATAADIENLMIEVEERVFRYSGISLKREIIIIGER